jgi:hypothetical protein
MELAPLCELNHDFDRVYLDFWIKDSNTWFFSTFLTKFVGREIANSYNRAEN